MRAKSQKQLQFESRRARRNSERSPDVWALDCEARGACSGDADSIPRNSSGERMEVRGRSLKALSMILMAREASASFTPSSGRTYLTPTTSPLRVLRSARIATGVFEESPPPTQDMPSFSDEQLLLGRAAIRRYSASDWFNNLRTWRHSLVLRRIRSPLCFNVLFTLLICVWHTFAGPLPGLADRLVSLPHTLLGSALGLLLVFRTNAAYDRFWEARKQWGLVTSECRTFASHVCTFMNPKQAWPILSLIIAFPFVTKSYLRSERKMDVLKDLLCEEEFQALSGVVNQPQYVLFRLRQLSHASAAAGLTDKEREILLKSASVLGECISACERIYNTPIPLAYSRHTSRFLSIYISTLPMALVSVLRWATMPVMFVVCWALFGILEIGNSIEEPFTAVATVEGRPLLPLSEVCHTIRKDVHAIAKYGQLAKDHSVPTFKQHIQKVNGFKVSKDTISRIRS